MAFVQGVPFAKSTYAVDVEGSLFRGMFPGSQAVSGGLRLQLPAIFKWIKVINALKEFQRKDVTMMRNMERKIGARTRLSRSWRSSCVD